MNPVGLTGTSTDARAATTAAPPSFAFISPTQQVGGSYNKAMYSIKTFRQSLLHHKTSFAAVPLTRSPDRKFLLPGPLPLHPQVHQCSGIYLWRAVRLTFSYPCEPSRVVHIQSCFYITRLRDTRLERVSYTSSGLERCLSYSQAWSSEFKLTKI